MSVIQDFMDASADLYGGAVYSEGAVDVVNSTFTKNHVTRNGGAICGKNVFIKQSVFDSNVAKGGAQSHGGAISSNSLKIDNCIFLNNFAYDDGGAIYAQTVTWVDSPSYFIGNYVDDNIGGAIYASKFETDVKYGVFINNTANKDDDGGAIYINEESHLTFSQCYFENNRCGDEGGAIYLDSISSTLALENNIFVDNWAGDKGNIVYNKGKYDKIHNNWYGRNSFDFSNELVEYYFWGSDKIHKDDKPVTVELSLNETGQPSKLIVSFLSDGELFNYDAKFSADNGAILTNHKTGNNAVTSDIAFNEGITTVTATVNNQVLTLSYSFTKENVTMNIAAPEISFGDDATVNITFTPNNATGTVSVGNVSSDIVNGTATVIISNLSVGNHTLQVSYSGDGLYKPAQGNVNITVNRKELNIDASAKPIYQKEDAAVIVTGLERATGNVTVTINNTNWTGEISNGTATIIINGLNDTTDANVTYPGDANYTNASTTVNIIVNSNPKDNLTDISASADPIMVGDDATVIVTCLENATGNVTVNIDGAEWFGEINNGTTAVIVTGLNTNVTANVSYAGDYRYNNATTTVKITVNPASTVWYVDGSKESSGNGTTPDTAFKTLKEALNKAPENSTIYIAPGTYTGESNTNLTINKNLTFTNYGVGEVIFDAQSVSRIWTVNAGRINITGLTFKNGKEEYVCGAIFFNQTLTDSYINAIFMDNSVVDGVAGAIGFYADVINTDINSVFINNSVNAGYGGAIFVNGNLSNVNISGNYTANTAGDYGGAILFYGDLNNVDISGNYTFNSAVDVGVIFFNGDLTDVNVSGYYSNNCANDTAGVFLFNSNLTNVVISGDYINNYAKDGINLVGEAYNVNMSGNYINNNVSEGGVIYIMSCGENSVIHDSIFINNTMDDELIIEVVSGSLSSVNNWFGNNATNYNIKPNVSENVTMVNWLFLNATTNTTGELKIHETSEITFKLYSYDSVSEEIKEYDASKMNIQLDLSQSSGTLNKTTASINETILYEYIEERLASVTGKFETASYTVILANPTELNVTVNYPETYDPFRNFLVSGQVTYRGTQEGVTKGSVDICLNKEFKLTVNVDNESSFRCDLGPLDAGTYELEVIYSDDTGEFDESEWKENYTINKANTTINIPESTIELIIGNSTNIGAVLSPSEAGELSYSSNDTNVATVDEYGNVNAVNAGTATIIVSFEGNKNYVAANQTVTATVNKIPTAITLANETFDLKVTDEVSAGATLDPELAGNLTYTSSDESVAKVENGNIIAVGEGAANVTVSFAGDDTYAAAEDKTISVTVRLNDARVSVNNSTLDLFVDDTFTIVATTVPTGLDVTYVPNDSGIVSIDDNGIVTALKEGTASIIVKVGGNGVYAENSTTVTVTVGKIPTELNVTVNYPQAYDPVRNFLITGQVMNKGTQEGVKKGSVDIYLNDEFKLTADVDNESSFRCDLGPLDADTYELWVKYHDGTGKFDESQWIENYTINQANTTIDIPESSIELIIGNSTNIGAVLSPSEAGNLSYSSNDIEVAGVDENGDVTAVGAGTATVTVSFAGNKNYVAANQTVTVNVNKIPTEIIVEHDTGDLNVNDEFDPVVSLMPSNAGNMSFKSSDANVALVNGHGIITAVGEGEATITVSFNGNNKYAAAESKNITVTVSLNDAGVSVNNSTLDLFVDDTFTIVATTVPAGLNVTYVPDDSSVVSVDDNGVVTALKEGTASIIVKVGGDGVYAENSTEVSITVSKIPTEITADDVVVAYKDPNGELVATITDASGKPLSADLNVELNGKSYSAKSGSDGQISIPIGNITPKTYVATITYAGNDTYAASSTTANVTVEKAATIISAEDISLAYKDPNGELVATIVNEHGKTLIVDLKVSLNGKTYTARTNSSGQASIPIGTLSPGTYDAMISYKGSSNYQTSNTTAQVTVTKAGTIITAPGVTFAYKDPNSELVATIVNEHGKPLIVNLNINFDGKTYTVRTNSSGQASIPIGNATSCKHTATITYKGSSNYEASNTTALVRVTKADTVITADDISLAYRDPNGELVATIVSEHGKTLIVNLNIELNGKTYNVRTNSSGQAAIPIGLLSPGTYTATITFNGSPNYKASNTTAVVKITKAETTITAPDVSVAYRDPNGELIVTVVSEHGKTLIVYLNVELNGKTYKVRTNSSGQASIPIGLLSPGNYTATIIFNGSPNYKASNTTAQVVVSKAATIITAEDVTLAYKDPTSELVATVVNEHGKTLIVDLKVKLNGKTYKVRTNSTGQASIPIGNLTPGTYTATITYMGSSNYEASNTTAQVTVTKADTIITAPDVTVVQNDPDGKLVSTIVNEHGKPLVVTMNVNLNGKTYSVKTDSNGQISVPTADLAPGTYTAAISYKGSSNYKASSATANVQVN